MSIHDRLTEAYRQNAASMDPASEPDHRVLAEFEKYAAGKRGSRPERRRKLWLLRLAVVAALIGVLSGFAHYVSLRIHDERVSIRYEEGIHRAWDASLQAEVQRLLQEVRSRLAEGESAVVYSPSIGKLFPELAKTPILGVSRPAMMRDWSAWQSLLAQESEYAMLPDLSGSGLSFEGGRRERLAASTVEDLLLLPELRREAEERAREGEQPAAWRIRPRIAESSGSATADLMMQYTSVYRDTKQSLIEIGVRRVSERTDWKLSVGHSAVREEIDLGGVQAVYVKNAHYIGTGGAGSATGQYQLVQWLITAPDSTMVYSVGSESLEITKEELVNMALDITKALKR